MRAYIGPPNLAGSTPLSFGKEVALLGRDEMLLSCRGEVLRLAGFLPCTVEWSSHADILQLAEAKVVVLCHTLTQADRRQLIHSCQERFSAPRLIALDAGHLPETELKYYAVVLDNLSGPSRLIESVREQFIRRAAADGIQPDLLV